MCYPSDKVLLDVDNLDHRGIANPVQCYNAVPTDTEPLLLGIVNRRLQASLNISHLCHDI